MRVGGVEWAAHVFVVAFSAVHYTRTVIICALLSESASQGKGEEDNQKANVWRAERQIRSVKK